MGNLFWVNILFFGLTAINTALFLFLEKPHALQITQSLLIFIVALPLTGLNLTVIIEKLAHQTFDFLERANIAAITSLVFVPFLLAFEYSKFHILFPTLPLINASVIFLIAIWIHPLALEKITARNILKEKLLRSFVLASLLYLTGLFVITLSYYPLPDLDPYYWLSKYSEDFSQNKLTYLSLYRPLFASLAYLFNQTAGVDLYAFFKYVLPFFLLLVLLPAALIARTFQKYSEQFAILLLPLASASLILYSQIPIPQAILNTILTYFVFFLLYAWLTEKHFFYFLAGAVIFGAYFYHEAAAIIFLPWFLVTLSQYRRPLLQKIRANKLAAVLILLLALSYATLIIEPLITFLVTWIIKGLDALRSLHTNFAFPATYVNVDGNPVGWGDWQGVIKYYAFYVGPAVFLLAFFLLWSQKASGFYRLLQRSFREKKEFLVLGANFLIFFSIAEILPRFFNVAFLPERAWGFAGLFLLSLIPIFFRYYPHRTAWIAPLFIAAFFINIGGALYINTLKKYLITPEQITSAEWIKNTLPNNRVIFTYGSSSLLKIHAQSKIISSKNPELYSDIRVFDASHETFIDSSQGLQKQYAETLRKMSSDLRKLRKENIDLNPEKIATDLELIALNSTTLKNIIETDRRDPANQKPAPLYIYYAKVSDKNPYAARPYFKEQHGALPVFVFDTYPDRFQRVYALPHDEIVIWQLLDKQ